MNLVVLSGRLGKDAEKRMVGNTPVLTFTLATSERYKDRNGERKEQTEWHNCEWWTNADVLKYLTKGKQLAVVGSIRYEQYKDKNGSDVYSTKIRVNGIEFVGDSKPSQTAPSGHSAPAAKPLYQEVQEQQVFNNETLKERENQ